MTNPPPATASTASQADSVEACFPDMPEPLRMLLKLSKSIVTLHQVPLPAVVVHALSATSALARGFVSSARAGTPVLPLLLTSPDTALPDWMAGEWEILEGITDLCHNPLMLDHPQQRAAQRRRERIRKMLDPEQMLVPAIHRILESKRLRFGQSAVTHGTRKLATPAGSHPLTHLCASLPRVRAVLRRISQGQPGESLIGWVGTREFAQLVKDQNTLLAGRVGLVLSIPASRPEEFAQLNTFGITSWINQCLVRSQQNRPRFIYDPGPEIAEALDAHTTPRQSWELPEVMRPLLPDPARVWHMATLLASLCDREDPAAASHAAEIAMAFDEWATAQHLHRIRLSYPADHQGWFAGTDLAVFRQVGEQPQRLRDIQRRLRGVRKDECLASLRRAIDAGLTVEEPGGIYRLPPPPQSGL